MMVRDGDNTMLNCLTFFLNHFGTFMFILAAIFIIFHRLFKRDVKEAEIVYRWVVLFGLAFTSIHTFILQIFYPSFAAAEVEWAVSQFQVQVGMAYLAMAVLGILSFRASYSFRLATVIGSTVWLWGSAGWYTWYLMKLNDYSFSNASSWPWVDLIIPMVLVFCMMRMQPEK